MFVALQQEVGENLHKKKSLLKTIVYSFRIFNTRNQIFFVNCYNELFMLAQNMQGHFTKIIKKVMKCLQNHILILGAQTLGTSFETFKYIFLVDTIRITK